MTDFVTVARVGDLSEGQSKTIRVGNKLVALFLEAGCYYAIDDTCPHMGASLAEGSVEGGIVTCSWHGWRFRLTDGTWADSPRVKIGSYPVRVLGDEIQVQLPS
jgi:nitrite reductase (NADH) small subunit/3-phenylpropionate/trans-cinnamate dioxygenase ferredoxin subunit